jgi:amino acid adenylation domain-containing protein
MDELELQGYRLSPLQRHLWRQEGDAAAGCALALDGELDRPALRAAARALVERHEALRTRLKSRPGLKTPLQVIVPEGEPEWEEMDLGDAAPGAWRGRLCGLLAERISRGLPTAGPSCRFLLVRLAADRHALLVTLPALFADATTLGNLARELAATCAGVGEPAEEAVQYVQFSEWRNEILEEDAAGGRDFWRALDETSRPLALPYAAGLSAPGAVRPARFTLTVEPSLAAALEIAAGRWEVPLPVLLFTAWQILLFRLTGEPVPTLFHTFGGRRFDELQGALGRFAGAVPVQLRIEEDFRFEEVLRRSRQALADAERLQEYFVPEESLWLSRELAGRAIGFEHEERLSGARVGNLTVSIVAREVASERSLLKLTSVREGGSLTLELSHDPVALLAGDVRGLAGQLHELLGNAVRRVPPPVGEIGLAGAAERQRLLVELNDTAAAAPEAVAFHQLFERQAAVHPERSALVCEDLRLTYGELDIRANRLAHHLRRLGVRPEDRVALHLERSAEAIVALLAVLKAGGAYVPLDPGLPPQRLEVMLEEIAAPVLLTRSGWTPAGSRVRVIHLDRDRDEIAGQPAESPGVRVPGECLAYVLFTSGSTGRPKGVAVEHRQLLNYVRGALPRLGLESGASYALISSFAADLGNTAIFPALSSGGCLYVVAQRRTSDPELVADLFRRHPVDCLKIVPSHLGALLEAAEPQWVLPRRLLVLGGEAASRELVARVEHLAPGCRILNHYGPTETTVGVMTCPVPPGQTDPRLPALPLGRPLANSRIYLLDAHFQPVPAGVAGELHVGGGGLSRGYLGRPELTSERFLPDPFGDAPGGRLYRTGDVARFLLDGEVRFEGRTDHQVKVRGFRVELPEIDAVLRGHPRVREAVTLLREDEPGQPRLVSYAVLERGSGVSTGELRELCRERLPEHMVPAVCVFLERLPLSANGKLDRRALPPPEQSQETGRHPTVAPRDLGEQMLAGLWTEVLGVHPVGVRDSFFDLGGHSLLATQLISRVRKVFGVELPLADFFAEPTVAGLARRVERAVQAGAAPAAPPIEAVPRDSELPLSFAQERIWFMQRLEPASSAYNVPRAMRLTGRLEVAALGRSLTALVERHESLRTAFPEVEGQPRQEIQPAGRMVPAVVDLSALAPVARDAESRRLIRDEARRPFDLARGPLLRATLLRLAGDEHLALLTMHHIVSDAWSMSVLVSEMTELYEALTSGRPPRLPVLPLQYADFAHWQRAWLRGEPLEKQLDFWRRGLSGAPEELLPPDFPRPAAAAFTGAQHSEAFPPELSTALQELSRREGVTLFMTLLAGFMALLHRVTGREDIAVGTDVANRQRIELESLIGFFVNNLVLRADLSGNPTFRELLAAVRRTTLAAYAHQDLPFDQLVKALKPRRSLGRTPLFQPLFVLQNAPRSHLRLGEVELEPVQGEPGGSKFDVALFLTQDEAGLKATWSYRTELFRPATVAGLAEAYQVLLAGVCRDPEARLARLEVSSQEGRSRQESERRTRDESRTERLRSVRRKMQVVPGEAAPDQE